MLELPAGRLTLDKPLKLTRAQTVLRGAGAKRTTLYLPKSFTDLYGGWAGGRVRGAASCPSACLWGQCFRSVWASACRITGTALIARHMIP